MNIRAALLITLIIPNAVSSKAIPDGQCAIITGATKSEERVLQLILPYREDGNPVAIQSNNGFLASSFGIFNTAEGKSLTKELVAQGRIPSDSYCGNADRFVAVLYPNADFSALQISSGVDFIAVGLGVSNVNGEANYKENSTSSYSKSEATSNTFGISLQFSELYLGYFSGKDSSSLKTKDSSGENSYPKLNTNISGLGVGFLWRDRFDIHAEVFQLDESAAEVEDSGSYYVNDESKTTGILLEIVTDLVNFGISYSKTNYQEGERYKDFLEDYDRETLSTALGFFFAENFNISYVVTTDKYEQKYKTSSEVFSSYDASSSDIAISYIF